MADRAPDPTTPQGPISRRLLELKLAEWQKLAADAGWNPETLAVLCSVSLRLLERFFKLQFKQSPAAWMRELRCRRLPNSRRLAGGPGEAEGALRPGVRPVVAGNPDAGFCGRVSRSSGTAAPPGTFRGSFVSNLQQARYRVVPGDRAGGRHRLLHLGAVHRTGAADAASRPGSEAFRLAFRLHDHRRHRTRLVGLLVCPVPGSGRDHSVITRGTRAYPRRGRLGKCARRSVWTGQAQSCGPAFCAVAAQALGHLPGPIRTERRPLVLSHLVSDLSGPVPAFRFGADRVFVRFAD